MRSVGRNNQGNLIFECKCDCGNITYVTKHNLQAKKSKTLSCGCLKRDKMIIQDVALLRSRIYRIYRDMKDRCLNQNSSAYKDYGGRGIKICDEWKNDFLLFYNWAINNGYKETLTIDRINNNGNYEPSNCRWATILQQANNKRNCLYIEYNGERKTAEQWAKEYGLLGATLRNRIKKGWTAEKAITTPVNNHSLNTKL